jgi:predicted ATPase
MRVKAVSVENIGGLVDQRIELPYQPFVAFAGPNGTGKTKLLEAIIGFWAETIPTPRDGTEASATLEVEFSDAERVALADLSNQSGWGQVPVPSAVKLISIRNQLAGYRRNAEPYLPTLSQFAGNPVLLQQYPSLNPVYLPAERRMLEPARGGSGIDLAQLADEVAFEQSRKSRRSIQNYGRLDDQEFEQFAKALCVAASLPDDPDDDHERLISRVQWPEFQETINELLHPKRLMPLTKAYPDQLRIKLPNGETHQVPYLSSGERQALVIVSRVLRAGAGQSLVIIDEPDAYLHPNLSQRLVQALQRGIGDSGQLLVATHSPAILDRIPPNSIFRLDYEKVTSHLADESGLIELHRTTGFRASALTQSELLVVTEGDLDEVILKALYPKLARASVQQGQGRAGVLQRVRHLLDYKVPVLGMVDRDVEPPSIGPTLEPHVYVLPTADLEGAFLCDDTALQIMVDEHYAKTEYRSLEALKLVRDELFASRRTNTIAELVLIDLNKKFGIDWPSPRAADALDQLRNLKSVLTPDLNSIELAINEATKEWSKFGNSPWTLVRGKYIIREFTRRCTSWINANDLLEAIASKRPQLVALEGFDEAIRQHLA